MTWALTSRKKHDVCTTARWKSAQFGVVLQQMNTLNWPKRVSSSCLYRSFWTTIVCSKTHRTLHCIKQKEKPLPRKWLFCARWRRGKAGRTRLGVNAAAVLVCTCVDFDVVTDFAEQRYRDIETRTDGCGFQY